MPTVAIEPTLHQRVRQQFGRTAVMITLVEELAEPELVRRGFRSEAGV
jgi:hypothetical protein